MHNAAHFVPTTDDVFSRIAGRYDLLCDLFSLGIHRLWKRRMAHLIMSEPWTRMIDVAAGTGDVALRVSGYPASEARDILVSDICPKMLDIATPRLKGHGSFSFRVLDAEAMPEIAAASVDVFSISLALKICDRSRVIAEARRVLRPGGLLIILEASTISLGWLHTLYLSYMSVCMPAIGWIATGGDASAYRYLLDGVRGFPAPEELACELIDVGFRDVTFERLSLGIVAIHRAVAPPAAHPASYSILGRL